MPEKKDRTTVVVKGNLAAYQGRPKKESKKRRWLLLLLLLLFLISFTVAVPVENIPGLSLFARAFGMDLPAGRAHTIAALISGKSKRELAAIQTYADAGVVPFSPWIASANPTIASADVFGSSKFFNTRETRAAMTQRGMLYDPITGVANNKKAASGAKSDEHTYTVEINSYSDNVRQTTGRNRELAMGGIEIMDPGGFGGVYGSAEFPEGGKFSSVKDGTSVTGVRRQRTDPHTQKIDKKRAGSDTYLEMMGQNNKEINSGTYNSDDLEYSGSLGSIARASVYSKAGALSDVPEISRYMADAAFNGAEAPKKYLLSDDSGNPLTNAEELNKLSKNVSEEMAREADCKAAYNEKMPLINEIKADMSLFWDNGIGKWTAAQVPGCYNGAITAGPSKWNDDMKEFERRCEQTRPHYEYIAKQCRTKISNSAVACNFGASSGGKVDYIGPCPGGGKSVSPYIVSDFMTAISDTADSAFFPRFSVFF